MKEMTEPAKMRALTILQPWAHLIATGEKLVENRTWATNYRGLLGIHAGRSPRLVPVDGHLRWPGMHYGAIVAVAYLFDCQTMSGLHLAAKSSEEHELIARSEFAEGPICWCLRAVVRIRPIPSRGQQGLWQPDPMTRNTLFSQWREAMVRNPLKPELKP